MKAVGHWAVHKPAVPVVGALCALVMGIVALFTLPIEQAPEIKVPVTFVSVPFPGASAEESETGIAIPLEERLAGLKNLKTLTVVSHLNGCTAICQFRDGADPDRAKRDARDALELAKPEFPAGVDQGFVRDVAFSDMPLITVSVSGGTDLGQRQRLADRLKGLLEAVNGVSRVEMFGEQPRDFLIEADPGRLSAHGLTLDDLAGAVRARARNIPGGRVEVPGTEFQARTVAQVLTAAELAATPVGHGNLSLGVVARVSDGRADLESLARVDGRDAVALIVRPETGINSLDVIETVRAEATAFGATLPPGMAIHLTGDTSVQIGYMVEQLGSTALYGGIVVLFLLIIAIGWRNAWLVAFAIPFCLLLTFVGFAATGISVTGIALFSLILVLGMVVDGAVIVMENIHRHWELGKEPREAAVDGLGEVGIPVLAADLTTVAAFAPMVFVSGITGQFIAVMPKVVAIALTASLIVDHVLLPLMAAWLLPSHKGQAPPAHRMDPRDQRRRYSGGRLLQAVQRLYRRQLVFAMRRRGWVAAGAALSFVAAVGWVGIGALGYEFFPRVDMNRFSVEIEMPLGTPVEQTDRVARRLERVVEQTIQRPPLTHAVTTVGNTRALNTDLREGGRSGPEVAKITCELVRERDRDVSQAELMDKLRPALQASAGAATVRVKELREGPPSGAPVAVRLSGGRTLDELLAAGARLRDRLRRVAGAQDVRIDLRPVRPQVQITPHPQKAALFHIRPVGVGAQIATALHGAEPAEITVGDERVRIRVRAAEGAIAGPESIGDLRVRSNAGGLIPVSAVATVATTSGPESIVRRNRKRTVTVRCDLQGGYEAQPVLDALEAWVGEQSAAGNWPRAVEVQYGAETDEETESVQSLQRLMGLSLVLILLILTTQFQSTRISFVVLMTVPLGFVGVVIGCWVLAIPIGFLPFVGVVALAGIVVNDAIVLVSCAQEYESQGVPRRKALVDAGVTRLRQVFLTTVTTVGGLLPLAFNIGGGGAFWGPLAWSLISGIIFATGLTLIVVPVLLDISAARRTWAPPAPAATTSA
ncbi:MAG: efflux RND transporter permease subunit [Planctomycetota bacterium]|jgi:multidrug efflux pump subunit AcrB